MRAVDTNIVVRCLADVDNPEQCLRARALVTENLVMVPTTVLLEAEWVLRRGYKLPKAAILDGITAFAALPTVNLDDPRKIAVALRWAQGGLDFADALHLAASETFEDFVTFDAPLARAAAKLATPLVTLLV